MDQAKRMRLRRIDVIFSFIGGAGLGYIVLSQFEIGIIIAYFLVFLGALGKSIVIRKVASSTHPLSS